MEYLAVVLGSRPLRLQFAFHNPEEAAEPVWVPRTLRPLGYFVALEVVAADEQVVFATSTPKVKMKLDPDADRSYMELSPGSIFGAVFEIPAGDLMPGWYTVRVAYDNGVYRGTERCPVGPLSFSDAIPLTVD